MTTTHNTQHTTKSVMNFLRRIMNNAARSTTASRSTTPLGRWQLHYDPNIVHSKVDQANEDHCGCCSDQGQQKEQMKQMKQMKAKQLMQQKQKWQEKKQQALMKKYYESENYYIPYVL